MRYTVPVLYNEILKLDAAGEGDTSPPTPLLDDGPLSGPACLSTASASRWSVQPGPDGQHAGAAPADPG